MNEDPSAPPPVPGRTALHKILWLVVALLPSLIGIAVVSMTNTDNGALSFLIILNAACSIAGSVGLVRGMEMRWLQVLVAIVLVPALFTVNVIIVIFIGCAMAMTTHGGF
jgi:hypothetical protein